jgi:hypothetical protein
MDCKGGPRPHIHDDPIVLPTNQPYWLLLPDVTIMRWRIRRKLLDNLRLKNRIELLRLCFVWQTGCLESISPCYVLLLFALHRQPSGPASHREPHAYVTSRRRANNLFFLATRSKNGLYMR